jgi:hypothetical protein
MTLYSTELTIELAQKTEQKEPLSLQELAAYIDKPYKTIDGWIKEGFILATHIHTGKSAHHRQFTYLGTFLAELLSILQDAGFGTQKIRESAKTVNDILAHPYGYVAIDTNAPMRRLLAPNSWEELSEKLKTHYEYDNSSPMLIIDLNRIHVTIANYHTDSDIRRELETCIMHLDVTGNYKRVPELVTVITDPAEYYLRGKRVLKSRFR